MATKLTNTQHYSDIADAIRSKLSSSDTYTPAQMAGAIESIPTGGGGDEPVPDDGKTRIWIHIAEETPHSGLAFYLFFETSAVNNTTVDWGDGTVETLGTGSSNNYNHRYSKGGDYIITITVNTGTISFSGTIPSTGFSIYGSRINELYYLRTRIKRIIFGDNVTIIGAYACAYCYGLASVKLPDGITTIEQYAFTQCYSIISVTIPDGVTSIEQSAFGNCYGMMVMTVPDSVTSIGASAFSRCYSMKEYHFKGTTPPTLANKDAFSAIQSDCIIYVPRGSLEAYQTATNWSTYASKMQEEPE